MSDFVRGQMGDRPRDAAIDVSTHELLIDDLKQVEVKKKAAFGKYFCETRVIGGKSECWIATDTSNNSKVFLKVMPWPVRPNESVKETDPGKFSEAIGICESWFQSQKQIIEKVSYKSVGSGSLVVPLDFFQFNRRYVKAYPIVQDKSLSFEETSLWGAETRKFFIRSLLLALNELHCKGVVHSDIKRENILVIDLPIGPIARLIDFDDAYDADSGPHSLRGTPELFSPEVLIRQHPEMFPDAEQFPLSCAADLFSLSLVLHEVFSKDGSLPKWSLGQNDDPAIQALSGGVAQYQDLGLGAPALTDRLKRCLAVRPSDRPKISALLSALQINAS
jgi:serine/threonine protein kinase